MLVFMGDFGVWTQVWSKGSCVGKIKIAKICTSKNTQKFNKNCLC